MKKSLIFHMLHHFITQCLNNMLLHLIETVIYQYFNLILQCYFNGHASGIPGGGRFLASCHLLGT